MQHEMTEAEINLPPPKEHAPPIDPAPDRTTSSGPPDIDPNKYGPPTSNEPIPRPENVPRADMVGMVHENNKVSLISNKADMTKIKTQLETPEYVSERDGWAAKM